MLLTLLKFTAWPEMSLWPYLMTKGWLPYTDIAIVHTPLMLIDLSIFYVIFGTGILQLKIFTWILILLLDVLVFVVTRKYWRIKTALLATAAFVFWSLFFDGNGLWFDLYMGTLAFCTFYFVKEKKWILSGIFWALAILSKQTAVWFALPILFELIGEYGFKIKNLGTKFSRFILGVLMVGVVFTVLLFTLHLLPSFWNWAVKFGIFILPNSQGQIQLPDIKTLFIALLPFAIFVPVIWKLKKDRNLILWAIAGFMGAYPRFEYFHFQPAIPFLAIAVGVALTEVSKKDVFTKVFLTLYGIGSVFLILSFFIRNFDEGTRFVENDVKEVASYVKYNTQKGDLIFVLNYWDNIYSLTDTFPAVRPWVPQLSWYTEVQGIEDKMVQGLNENPPKLVVFKPYTNFGLSSYIPKKVYGFVTDNYKLDTKIDGVEILIRK